eukprot:TRINITY_DN2655_c0_g1_i11.p1 TRINITY_DN2655_c0_g1~~TRINITY_DN2655_c0_g1_i11.p1  ORF type:complete len:334 (+),score=37.51 TRINITY_DN2655_c0_g1_i11:88-1089(+)
MWTQQFCQRDELWRASGAQGSYSCGNQAGFPIASERLMNDSCGTTGETGSGYFAGSVNGSDVSDGAGIFSRSLRSTKHEEWTPSTSVNNAHQRGYVDGRRQVVKVLVSDRIGSAFQALCDKAERMGMTLDVRLSAEGSCFPGTSARICVFGGSAAELECHLRWILEQSRSGQSKTQVLRTRLVVPNSAVSAFIGKGGENITHIRQVSSCRINVSKRVQHSKERIAIFCGSDETELLNAMMSIVSEIQANPHDEADESAVPYVEKHEEADESAMPHVEQDDKADDTSKSTKRRTSRRCPMSNRTIRRTNRRYLTWAMHSHHGLLRVASPTNRRS